MATHRGIQLQSLEVRDPNDFDRAFKAAVEERAEGLIVISSRLLLTQRRRVLEFMSTAGIPAVGNWGDWAIDGFLFTYGPNTNDALREIAVYLDKILRGIPPRDLPIQRPTHFELVVNMKTAKALGIKLPDTIIAREDKVIE